MSRFETDLIQWKGWSSTSRTIPWIDSITRNFPKLLDMIHNDGIWGSKGIKHDLKCIWIKKVPYIHRTYTTTWCMYSKKTRFWPNNEFWKVPKQFKKSTDIYNIYNIYRKYIVYILYICFINLKSVLGWFQTIRPLHPAWPIISLASFCLVRNLERPWNTSEIKKSQRYTYKYI